MRKTFEIPLDIPDVTIENVETDRNRDLVITVKSTVEGTYCHTCGKKITKVYGYDREITFRHLSILGRKTYIRLRPVRYQCPSCDGNPTTTQQLSWYTPRSSYTKPYEELGCLNRPSAVDRFLDFSSQSRFSHVWWPSIFNHTRGLLRHQRRPILVFTTH